jgi:two-component system CheB/CheR fusion protein
MALVLITKANTQTVAFYMTLLNDPLFQAALDAAFPRVILFPDATTIQVISYNAAAAALLKGEAISELSLSHFVEAKYRDQHTDRVITEAIQTALNTEERALLYFSTSMADEDDLEDQNWLQVEIIPIKTVDNVVAYLLVNLISLPIAPSSIQKTRERLFKQQNLSEELDATNEELSASNEELTITVEALNQSQESLRQANEVLEKRVRERTQALQQSLSTIQEERKRLSNIIANLPAGVCILKGREYILEDVNEGMLKIWGKDRRILGCKLLDFMPELIQQSFPALLEGVYTNGVAYIERDARLDIINEGIQKTLYLDFSYTPLFNAKKEVDRILVHADDVTERTLARLREQHLSEELSAINEELSSSNEELAATNDALSTSKKILTESESTLKFMFNAIPQQVWTSSAVGELNYVNQLMCEDFGQNMEVLLSQGWRQYIHPDDLRDAVENWTIALQTSQPFTAEYRLRFKDGKYYWHMGKAAPMVENVQIKFWIGTNTNIELQKASEQKKDEFLSIASHELKTPLTSIKAFNQLISRTQEITKVQHFSTKSAEHIEKLEWLINDLLDVTKINAGKMVYNMQPLNFRKLLLGTIDTVQQTSTTHRIVLKGNDEIEYVGDYLRLEQVIHNFLSNAIKYSPNADQVIVEYRMEMGNIIVSVQDFGIGIARKDFNRLFDRYYRVDNSSMRFEGLGLGLYISSEILKRHQGSFWIESEEGNGSTFFFRLPIDVSKHNHEEINEQDFYKNRALSIVYNQAEHRLDVDWTGFQDLQSVQQGCLKMRDMLCRYHVEKILNDNSHVLGTWSDASDWVGEVWFPMMEKAGLRHFAWIYSPAAFSQLSAQKAADVAYGTVTTRFFTDINLARAWLGSLAD